jgi:predicted RNA-binding Zn ribbon-like protein
MSSMETSSPPPAEPPSDRKAPGPFELSGGALCLDFVNTWGDRARPESDQLRSFADLLAFAAQAGLVAEPRRRELAAGTSAVAAAAVCDEALRLRESLYRLFTACARDHACPAQDVATLNAVLEQALAHLRIEAQSAAATFAWSFAPTNLPAAPLWPIARSAADLLVSPDLARVTQCDGSGCTWLFLDQSRTRNRRWCSMQSCGNRAKARRHYHRSKG